MLDDLRPYAEYKDSGVPWLGMIPTHWQLQRAKTLFRESQIPVRGEDEIVTCFRDGQVTLRRNRRIGGFMNALLEVGYKGVRRGQLVIHSMDAFAGAIGVSDSDGKCTGEYVVCDAARVGVVPGYYALLLRLMASQDYIRIVCPAVRERAPRLRFNAFSNMTLPMPSHDEQQWIVRFLDAHGKRVAAFIRNRRHLIALLNEQKQVFIHDAVTHGLDSEVTMKASGEAWLGQIPKHWSVQRLKHVARFENGIAFKPGDWKSDGVPIIRIENLNGANTFNFTNRRDLPANLLIQPGDLLFAWSGNRGTSFGSFLWERAFPGYLNQHIFKVTASELHPKYLYYALRAVTKHIEDQAHGIIGLVHVTGPTLRSVAIPVPSEDEQATIADNLDSKLQEIHSAIRRMESEVTLVREHLLRLVSDVVTGKVDVRHLAPEQVDADLEAIEALGDDGGDLDGSDDLDEVAVEDDEDI